MRKIYGRHGKAAAANKGQKDVDRPLNEIGLKQAGDRKDKLNDMQFDLVLSSPASRALSTAVIVTQWPVSDIVILDALYPEPDDNGVGARLDKLFQALAYKPVADYLAADDGSAVTEWAAQTYAECEQEIQRIGNPQSVGIFGHAVCSQALAMEDCRGNDELVEKIAGMELGECHLIIVDFDANGKPIDAQLVCD